MKHSLLALVCSAAVALSSFGEEAKKEPSCGCELLGGYVDLSEALASDDFQLVKKTAAELLKSAQEDNIDGVIAGAKAVAAAPDIAAARTSFKALTPEIVPLAAGNDDYVLMTCPMAHADWIQAKGDTHNPYYGKAMLNCGKRKKITSS